MTPKHFLSSSVCSTDKHTLPPNLLFAEVEFGRLSRGCDGVGICRIMVEPMTKVKGSNCKSSKVQLYKQEDFLVFHFLRDQLCPCLCRVQFRRDYFLMEEPVPIPWEIQSHFRGIPPQILKGRYPLVFSEDAIKILIRV